MSLYKDFLDTVHEAIHEEHISEEEFCGGIFIIADVNGQFVVTSESSTEEVITLLKTAIKVIENSYNEIPDLKN